MNRKILVFSILALSAVSAVAAPRSKSDIMEAASRTLIKGHPGMRRSPSKNARLEVLRENSAFTVVGFDGGAYAIVSNDDLLPEILGYSASAFDMTESSPSFQWWCRSIEAVANEIVRTGEPPNITLPDPARFPSEVPHLLSDVWGQTEPFNNHCPLEYDAAGRLLGRCVVGCVATSATQVMRYHQYPERGQGVHIDMQTTDAHGNAIPLKVDFANHVFDFSKMRDSFSPGTYTPEEGNAVAEFSHAVGVSFGMIYSTGASGTYSDSAVVSLREHFGYNDARLLNRKEYDERTWMEYIYKELSESRPILYSGADPWGTPGGGGHAFVFDGYDASGLVHVNWGWFGRNDGYYEVGLLNPRIHSFVEQQDMIIGVAPPYASAPSDAVLRLTGAITRTDIADAVAKSKSEGVRTLDLSGAKLPDDMLPAMAFYGSLFQEIILPSGLRSIGNGAFANCRRLTNVVFPESDDSQDFVVESGIIYSRDGKEVIAVMPYYHNNTPVITDFTSLLTFKDGVTTLRPHCADGCFRIQGVEIPATVTLIGEYAFANATNLKVVNVKSALPARAAAMAFASLDAGFTKLYIPAGTAETFSRAGEWGHFFDFDNVYELGTNIKARNIVRKRGEENPELTYQVFGDYVTGEPELSCDATADSEPGEYVIKVSMGSLQGEGIVLTDGVLRVLDKGSGVESVSAQNGPFDIYNVDGSVVALGVMSLESLENGLYIINGVKVMVE